MSVNGEMLVQQARAKAKKQAAKTKGTSGSLLSTAKNAVDGGLSIQYTDVYGALSRFYFAAYVIQRVIDSAEYKSNATPLNKDASELYHVISHSIAPLVKKLEAKLRSINQQDETSRDQHHIRTSAPSPISSEHSSSQGLGSFLHERWLSAWTTRTSATTDPALARTDNINRWLSVPQRPSLILDIDPMGTHMPSSSRPTNPHFLTSPTSVSSPTSTLTSTFTSASASTAPSSNYQRPTSSGYWSPPTGNPYYPSVVANTQALSSITEDFASLHLSSNNQPTTHVSEYSGIPSSTSTAAPARLSSSHSSQTNSASQSPPNTNSQSFGNPPRSVQMRSGASPQPIEQSWTVWNPEEQNRFSSPGVSVPASAATHPSSPQSQPSNTTSFRNEQNYPTSVGTSGNQARPPHPGHNRRPLPTPPRPGEQPTPAIQIGKDVADLSNSNIRGLRSEIIVSLIRSLTGNTVAVPSGNLENMQRQRMDLELMLRGLRTQERAKKEEIRSHEQNRMDIIQGGVTPHQGSSEPSGQSWARDNRRGMEVVDSRSGTVGETLRQRVDGHEQARVELEAQQQLQQRYLHEPEQQRLKEERDHRREGDCVICQDVEATFSILDCGHMCICQQCSVEVLNTARPRCPICRSHVRTVMRIFRS